MLIFGEFFPSHQIKENFEKKKKTVLLKTFMYEYVFILLLPHHQAQRSRL